MCKRKVTILILLTLLLEVGLTHRASFGEDCSKKVRCDSKASLTCESNTCICIMSEKMVFDKAVQACVIMAGEKCVYTAVEMDDLSETEVKKWREELACVTHATCTDGYCTCWDKYFENSHGICEEKHSHGETCGRNSHCNEDKHLVCINRKCECDLLSAFDASRAKCVGRAGSLCKTYPECVTNAKCHAKPTYNYKYQDYTTETCQCQDGYTRDFQGRCRISYDRACDHSDESKQCLPDMVCREGKCSCKYDNHQLYDARTNRCKSLVGGPCRTSLWRGGCVEQAECIVDSNVRGFGTIGKCDCKEGFIEVNRRCEIAIGGKCPSLSGIMCDSIAPLQCISGICQCNFLEYFDNELKVCRGLIDSTCIKTKENFCTNGAVCKSYRNTESQLGYCACQEGFMKTEGMKCYSKSVAVAEVQTEAISVIESEQHCGVCNYRFFA